MVCGSDMMKFLWCLLLCSALSACGTVPSDCAPPAKGDVVYVVGQGWHAELGIPVVQLDKNMQYFKKVFHGARVIMFGYGKRTFFTAQAHSLNEYILGPVPGPAVIHAVGLYVTPLEAYPPEDTVVLALPPGGSHALSQYIWNDFVKGANGKPAFVSRSSDPDGMFYDSVSEYNLFHTCNTWTAEALQAAGLPVSGDNVVFSGQVMDRVDAAAESQCGAMGK